ncbi:MAG: GNAT family N-acetyltransferase [Bacteroidota bacterium]
MLIRDYRRDDYPGLVSLWQSTGLGNPERGDNEEVIDRCNAMGGRLLVMVDETSGRLVGSSWMTFDGRRMFLHHFGIAPDLQNRGLGKKLLEATLLHLKEKGHQVKLEVHSENHAAIHLYKTAGFFDFQDYDIFMIRNIKEVNYHP